MVLKNKEFCETDSMCGEGKYCNTITNYCISTDQLAPHVSFQGTKDKPHETPGRRKINCTDNQVCGEGEICKKEQDEGDGYCVPDEISWDTSKVDTEYPSSEHADWALNQNPKALNELREMERNNTTNDLNIRRLNRSDLALRLAQGVGDDDEMIVMDYLKTKNYPNLEEPLTRLTNLRAIKEQERIEAEQKREQKRIEAEQKRIEAEQKRIEAKQKKAEQDALEYAVNYPNWARLMPFTSETVNSFFPSARAKEIEKDMRMRKSRQQQDPFAGVSSVSPTMSWGGKLKQNKKKRKITKRKNKTKRKITKRKITKRKKTKRRINK